MNQGENRLDLTVTANVVVLYGRVTFTVFEMGEDTH